MTNVKEFQAAPTAKMLKNAIHRAKRTQRASSMSKKAFGKLRKDIGNALLKAVAAGEQTLEVKVDVAICRDTARLVELNTWFKEADVKAPTVAAAPDGSCAVLTFSLS